MGKKKTKVVTIEATTTEANAVEVPAPTEPKPRRKKSKAADADVQVESPATTPEPEPPADLGPTLEDLAAGYLAHLEDEGKSQGTVFSYARHGSMPRRVSIVSELVSNDYTVSYTYAKQTTGRNTIRRTSTTLPSGKTISYTYLTRNGIYDNPSSRVTEVKDGSVALALYDYLGVGQVVGTDYTEADVIQKLYQNGSYDDLDRFNRVVKSRWTKDLGSPVDFYRVELTYDRDSNITSADDQVQSGFDVKYTMDDVNRLTRAEEGTLGGGSISSRTRDEQWALSHTGNWDRDKVDLNGDGDFVDSGEVDDTRAHNAVNELQTRDTDSNSSVNYTLVYDGAGNLTDDNKDYKYEYDAFYRLRKIKKTSNSALIAEYRYNGLGYKIAVHEDTDTDNDVDSSDKWYYDAFDERWRQVARFRESDSNPKEEFVSQSAGANGLSGSSYIDQLVCRYKDADSGWTAASDGTLEERVYLCANQHADTIGVIGADGSQWTSVKYAAYGTPIGLPGGDVDSDGDTDSSDVTQVQGWIGGSQYDVRGDVDLDGDVDATDKTAIQGVFLGITLGRTVLCAASLTLRSGYGGYPPDHGVVSAWYARRRWHSIELGRWQSRDANGYDAFVSLYEYVSDMPMQWTDPQGLSQQSPVLWGGPCYAHTPEVTGGAGQTELRVGHDPQTGQSITAQFQLGAIGKGRTGQQWAVAINGNSLDSLNKTDGNCAPNTKQCSWSGNIKFRLVKKVDHYTTDSRYDWVEGQDYGGWHGPNPTVGLSTSRPTWQIVSAPPGSGSHPPQPGLSQGMFSFNETADCMSSASVELRTTPHNPFYPTLSVTITAFCGPCTYETVFPAPPSDDSPPPTLDH